MTQSAGPDTNTRRKSPAGQRLLLAAVLLVLSSWALAALDPAGRWATLLDNVHWTASYLAAALLAWLGVRQGSGVESRVRRWFALGLSCLAGGQVLWDLQVYFDWNPFPGPSDALFLLLGPGFFVGLALAMRAELPTGRFAAVAFDVGGFALSSLALALTLYLPRGASSTALQLLVMTLYPVLLLAAGTTALVMHLHLRQVWTPRWIALLAGLGGHGVAWMIWNLQTLDNTLAAGAPLNLAFSLLTLLLGWGAAGWRLQADATASFDRLCEGLLRQLPLAMVATASASLGLLVLDGSVPESVRSSLLALSVLVLLFAIMRQTQQLGERDRLLVAERAVAESQARLQHLAHHDPLTGLPNLTLLRDRVQQALAEAHRERRRVALMFVDLDQFKEVNDTLGHAIGDRLLCHVARQLSDTLRAADTVSRQGGDEFALVLRDVGDLDEVAVVAEKVMQLSRGTADIDGHELPLAMSVGIALYPDDGDDFDGLLQRADTAMYKAKAAGRSAYRFYDMRMNDEATERMRLRARLANALQRNELSLHYQPQVDLASGRIFGAEALLRWSSPDLGSVPPAAFIPVAEDSGQIVEIGAWVLRQACQDAMRWTQLGQPPLTVAVNLSVLQFRRGNLEQTVTEALRASGLAPERLELEITESVLMRDHDRVFVTVDRLKQLGVRLSIDDFGTGYSSLSYVRRLRVSKLKIDRSFIQDASGSAGGAGIVQAVIEMARVLGVTTLAEGVETEAQREFLCHSRCNEAQGYLFGRPMPAAEFEAFIAQAPSIGGIDSDRPPQPIGPSKAAESADAKPA